MYILQVLSEGFPSLRVASVRRRGPGLKHQRSRADRASRTLEPEPKPMKGGHRGDGSKCRCVVVGRSRFKRKGSSKELHQIFLPHVCSIPALKSSSLTRECNFKANYFSKDHRTRLPPSSSMSSKSSLPSSVEVRHVQRPPCCHVSRVRAGRLRTANRL